MNCKVNNNIACLGKYDFYDINIKQILMFRKKSADNHFIRKFHIRVQKEQIFEIIPDRIYMPQLLFFWRNHDQSSVADNQVYQYFLPTSLHNLYSGRILTAG